MSYPPFSPFSDPVPPPDTDPSGGDNLHIVCFDRAWLSVVLTSLRAMVDPSSWAGDVNQVKLATVRAQDLLAAFIEGCADMPDFDPCCEDTNDLLTDLLDVSQSARTVLGYLLDCCKSLAAASAMQQDILRDDFGGDDPEDPASVDEDIPDGTYGDPDGAPPDDIPDRLIALCVTIDEVTAWAWAKAMDEWRLLFNLVDILVPIVKELPGGLLELAEELFTSFSSELFADEDAKQTIRCCMYERMKEQDTHSVIAFAESLGDCEYPWLSHENVLKQIVVSFCSDPRNWHAFHRAYLVNYKRSKHDELMSTADCICRENCWDFEDGDAQGMLPVRSSPFGIAGWDPGGGTLIESVPGAITGWVIGAYMVGSTLGVFARLRNLTDITHVTARFWAAGQSVGRPWHIKFWSAEKEFITQLSGTLAGGEMFYDVSQDPAGAFDVKYISIHAQGPGLVALDILKLNDSGLEPCGPG